MPTFAERFAVREALRNAHREKESAKKAEKKAKAERDRKRLAQAERRARAAAAPKPPRATVIAAPMPRQSRTEAPEPEHWQGKLRAPRPGTRDDAQTFRHRGVRLRVDGFLNHEMREICCVFAALVDECRSIAEKQHVPASQFTKQLRHLSPIVAVPGATSEQRKASAIKILENARTWIRGAALENTPLGLYLENHVNHPRNVDRAIQSSHALGMASSAGGARGSAPGVPVVGAVRGRAAARVLAAVGVGAPQADDRNVRSDRINRPRGHGARR